MKRAPHLTHLRKTVICRQSGQSASTFSGT
jgi:hypothetical protein